MDSVQRVDLPNLPPELLLHTLSYLDLPDLLSVSRTSHTFRSLTLDPLLHIQRLHGYRYFLSHYLPNRPSLSSIRPPSGTIYLTHAHCAARALSRKLVSLRLKRKLSQRPDASSLVQRNVLPAEVYAYSYDTSPGKGRKAGVAPSLVGAKRSIERERVKDSLRNWLEGRPATAERERRQRQVLREEKRGVRDLVRRFKAWAIDEERPVKQGMASTSTGRRLPSRPALSRKDPCEAPTRANVLGLRRFWEGLASVG